MLEWTVVDPKRVRPREKRGKRVYGQKEQEGRKRGKEERGKHFPSLFGYTCSGGVGSTNRLLVLVGKVKRGTQEVKRKTRRGSLLFCRSDKIVTLRGQDSLKREGEGEATQGRSLRIWI